MSIRKSPQPSGISNVRFDPNQISMLLPKHHVVSFRMCCLYMAFIVTSTLLVFWSSVRLLLWMPTFHWWYPLVALAGMATADFGSGMIHWTADTWGSVNMPLIGQRFLHPFRVHHINPDDFLSRTFSVTNGDVALLVLPVLAGTCLLPLSSTGLTSLAIYLTALCAAGLPTNQVHQWSHIRNPPLFVKLLQQFRVILSQEAHARHHKYPHNNNYCIALGWCNPLLNKINFWRKLERIVSWSTGLVPRSDEDNFIAESLSQLRGLMHQGAHDGR